MKLLLVLSIIFSSILYNQTSEAAVFRQPVPTTWHANWIVAAGDGGDHYGVYYFRKQVNLPAKPASFKIYVSADNRYKLYVNGKLVSLGPARGDNFYWNYETVDIAPYLTSGKNTVAAMVFNEAQYRPEAQITVRTAFIVQGASTAEEVLNTNDTWRCIADKAFQPIPGFFFAAIKGQLVDMNQTISGWNMPGFDDAAWPMAANLFQGQPKGNSDGFGWMLVPSPLPQMELTYQRIPTLREEKGIDVPQSFPGKKTAFTIAPHTTATLLLDQNYETNAYITLNFSGGAHAGISMRYAESLFDNLAKNGRRKGNRNEVKGKDFMGVQDSVLSNGKAGQTFTTLYWRSFRYLLLTIQTKDDPLVIDDLYGTFTGYPFKQRAVLNTNNAEMKTMLDIGWRTARLCAMETYFDCPFYEQLQYIGDTRIQAMVSYYNAGDDSLARHAISLIDQSRSSEGVTQSRWPTHDTQIIPGFSLWYIGMLHDYWMYRNDPIFVKRKLAGTRAILNFFSNYQQPDGSLKDVPYWTFVDWAGDNGWNFGGPPKGKDGSSAVFDLQLLWAYQWASAMETSLGMPAYAKLYQEQALKLKQTIQRKYWSEAKQLYAETAEKNTFSQHTNALAILTGVANEGQYQQLGQKILADHSLTQCSIYFKYYMHMALVKAGMGDDYLSWLDVWRENIKLGLTTWAEEPDVQTSRSDCHAWGASPNIEFYRTLLGIDSYAPGFAQIKVQPHLGTITHLSGSIPHPNGKIEAAYTLKNGKWDIRIALPPKTSGIFVWKNKNYTLKAGANTFKI